MLKSLFPSRRLEVPTTTRDNNCQQQTLQEILVLLKSKRENLKAGRSRLTLSASHIQELCSKIYTSKPNTTESPSLSDLLLCVKALRIASESGRHSPDPNQVVNLSPFHNLTYLEVNTVSVSHFTNLSKLRSQLNHLVLYACIDSLNTVLLECGGDKCVDSFLWSELQSLYVTSCPNLDLGKGLQLAPWLKTLDLSFNCLDDNGIQSLSSLLTIHKLILNFNYLLRIPVLAPSARTTLKILHLRQNQLETVRGIEQLGSLQELDIAYNCIANGEALSALCSLPHLVKLCLESNPISYSKDYRLTVVRRLSTAVNKKKFCLDGQPLTPIEKDSLGTMATLYLGQPEIIESWRASRQPVQITVQEASIIEEPERIQAASTPVSNGQHTPVNRSPIAGLLSSPAAGSVNKLTLSGTKKRKGSRMREVEIADAASQSLGTPEPVQQVASDDPTTPDAVHLATKQRLEELRQTFGEENWLHMQAGNQVRQLLGWQDIDSIPSVVNTERLESEITKRQETSQSADENRVKDDAIIVLTSETEIPSASEETDELIIKQINEDDETADLNVFVVQRQIKDELFVERLLTVSTVFFHEKDSLNGQTISCWRRSSLQRVLLLEEPSITHPKARIQFSFHPVIRNGNEPIYLVDEDDFNELKSIGAISQTILESTSPANVKGQVNDHMSCMKCDKKFPSACAAVKLRKAVNSPLLKGQLEEYPACPSCGSDMVFSVDQPQKTTIEDSSTTSSSSHSGSDVIVAPNEPYTPRNERVERASSEDSEEGSVEVVDRKTRLVSVPSSPIGNGTNPATKAPKSCSSRSASSKSSSRASRTNRSGGLSSPSFSFSYADFSQVDHRLRLYCEMVLLSHQSEEFYGLIKTEIVAANGGAMNVDLAPIAALIVVTSLKIYVLKITSYLTDQPEKWLMMESNYTLSHLTKVLTIIGYQGLILQFSNSSQLLVLLRDQKRTKNMTHFLTSCLEKSGLPNPSSDANFMASQWTALDGLVTGDQDNLSMSSVEGTDVLVRSTSGGSNRVFLFCLTCRTDWETSKEQHHTADYQNAALMVTSDRIALIRGDLRWLSSPQVEFRTWGVSIIGLHQVVNLVSLESFVSKPEQLRFYFLDETSNLKEQWTVELATREAVDQLIEAVRYPWEAMFSVELEINELDE